MRGDDGNVSVFVAVVAMALIVVAGLVLDGGRLLTARRQAHDIAGAAARAGAQAVSVPALRSGRPALTPARARRSVAGYLAATPASGTARITGDRVEVEVTMPVDMLLLRVVGVGARTVTATAEARAVQGVELGES